jgi:omega-6 fatty acid desaturase (delta-12 desaturase)
MINNKTGIQDLPWRKWIASYQTPITSRSLWQMVNTILPFVVMWALMAFSLNVSYWLTFLLAFPTAGFMVRTFIIFHDCCHGSFFRSSRANAILGFITGVLTFTDFGSWRRDHNTHHATAGDLDRRGVGDVMTLTVQEYLALSPWKRFTYRVMRSPWILFTIGATLVFLFAHRFPGPSHGPRERMSILWHDLALAGLFTILVLLLGIRTVILVQLPVLFIGASVGIWLFYVQHQFEGVYWERHQNWVFERACMEGCSYYQLPRLLQWFSGNIGFHHIHHLSPRIPNYALEDCLRENLGLQIKPLTLRSSLQSLRLRVFDESSRQLVGWEVLRQYKTPAG